MQHIRRHEDYHRWVEVGKGLLRLEQEAMHFAGANSPYGRRYTAVRAELGKEGPDLETIDRTSKAHAKWLAEHFVEVNAWHQTLGSNERERLNHPTAIKRRYEAARTIAGADKEPGEKKPSATDKLKIEIARLIEEIDNANAKIRKLERAEGDLLLISRKDSAEEILGVLESEVPTKAGRIASILLNRQKGSAPRRRARRVPEAANADDTAGNL